MDIQRKIEEIRSQPEHIRLKYVWMCVAISMVFIVLLWLFSLTTSFQRLEESPSLLESLPSGSVPQSSPITEPSVPKADEPSLEDWVKQK